MKILALHSLTVKLRMSKRPLATTRAPWCLLISAMAPTRVGRSETRLPRGTGIAVRQERFVSIRLAGVSRKDSAELQGGRGKKSARQKANGGGEKITEAQRTLLLGKATKRARELGIEDADAGLTLLNTVLAEGGIRDARQVLVDQLNEIVRAIATYDFPGA